MPITINGSGTVTGISAGGLPDNIITNAEMADDAINTAELADDAVDQARIAANAVGLAELAGIARGKLIVGDASGDPSVLSAGSANQVLTSDGTDLSWAAAGGGEIKQIKWDYVSTYQTGSSTYTDTGHEIEFTQTASGNYTLVFLFGATMSQMGYGNPPNRNYIRLLLDGTENRKAHRWHTNGSADNTLNEEGGGGYDWQREESISFVQRHQFNDTSAHTWKFQTKEVATTHYGAFALNDCIMFCVEVENNGN